MEKFNYNVGDAILIKSNDLLYKGKCLKRFMNGDGSPIYFVHYRGWKSNRDEWVYEDVLLEVNDANLKKKKELEEKQKEKISKCKKKKVAKKAKVAKKPKVAENAKVCNKRKINYKRSNQPSKKTSKSIDPSSVLQTSKTPIDFQPGIVMSNEVQVTESTPSSSLDFSSQPMIKKEPYEVIDDISNIKTEIQETNQTLTLTTADPTRYDSLEVSRFKRNSAQSTGNVQQFSSNQINGITTQQHDLFQEGEEGSSKFGRNIELIDLTNDETETVSSTITFNDNEPTRIIADCLSKMLTNPASCGISVNFYFNGDQGLNEFLMNSRK